MDTVGLQRLWEAGILFPLVRARTALGSHGGAGDPPRGLGSLPRGCTVTAWLPTLSLDTWAAGTQARWLRHGSWWDAGSSPARERGTAACPSLLCASAAPCSTASCLHREPAFPLCSPGACGQCCQHLACAAVACRQHCGQGNGACGSAMLHWACHCGRMLAVSSQQFGG